MTTTTQELVAYYPGLLIFQYEGQPKAYAQMEALTTVTVETQTSVQKISFSETPEAGSFSLKYSESTVGPFSFNADPTVIQAAINGISGLSGVTVSGAINSLNGLTFAFSGVLGVADLLLVTGNTLSGPSGAVILSVSETDKIIPLAVEGAFNLTAEPLAEGVQLDTLGKYVGVSRFGAGITGEPISLGDADFRTLIRFRVALNSAGSSLYDIQNIIYSFFPGQVLVFDYANMQISYLVSSEIGSFELIQLVISEGLLPKPMAVGIASIIVFPTITEFFGMRTYEAEAFNSNPFNTYDDYKLDWPWLSYSYAYGPGFTLPPAPPPPGIYFGFDGGANIAGFDIGIFLT